MYVYLYPVMYRHLQSNGSPSEQQNMVVEDTVGFCWEMIEKMEMWLLIWMRM
jgi:hypothetical protein